VKTIRTGGSPTCVRAGAGSIWVGSQGTDDVYRIDPATNAVTPIAVGKGDEVCVDPHDDGVWVSNGVDNSVSRIDPATSAVAATTPVGLAPADGVRGPDGLEWIPNRADGTISRIDPATNTVVDTLHVTKTPFVVRFAFGDMWVDDFGGFEEWRIHVP
jgi:YVTN family beta-propeller protein